MRGVIGKLIQAAGDGCTGLELANDVELERVWLDSTCVKANMHFPVDWVLLRDGVRTLMKATALIRRHGLKSRMDDPAEFLKRMNRLSIEMTQSRRSKDAKRLRKKCLRKMKKLVHVITEHAQRHRELLDREWEKSD
jgi:replicative DNA helicase